MLWCGARNGGRSATAARSLNAPRSDYTAASSSASDHSRSGSSDPKASASIVLPDPGGPVMRTLWPPAAAISRQRFEQMSRILGELVEEQHAVVGERDLARARRRASADQPGS